MKALIQRLTGQKQQYNVQVNTSAGIVTGIVRVQLETRKTELQDIPVDFSVEILEVGSGSCATKRVIPGEAHTSWIAFHSHLLNNGRYTIQWRAGDSSGRLWVQVRNSGELASQVGAQLQSDEVPLFLTGPCDSALYRYHNNALRPWYDQPDCHAQLDRLL